MIVSILSYRGGSGKSLLALQLSFFLNEHVDTVLLEADFLAPNLHHVFSESEIMNSSCTWNDYLLGKCGIEEPIIRVPVNENVLRAVFTRPDDENILSTIQDKKFWKTIASRRVIDFFNMMKKQKKSVIVDNQSGFFLSTAVHSFFSDFVLIVVRPSIHDVKGTYHYVKALGQPFYLVWNHVIEGLEEYIEEWTEMFSRLKSFRGCLAKIPFDAETARVRWTTGKAIVENTPYARKVQAIGEYLLNLDS